MKVMQGPDQRFSLDITTGITRRSERRVIRPAWAQRTCAGAMVARVVERVRRSGPAGAEGLALRQGAGRFRCRRA